MTFKEIQETGNKKIESQYIKFKKTKTGERAYNTKLAAAYKQASREIQSDLKNLYAELAGLEPEDYYNFTLKYDRLSKLKKQAQDAYIKAANKAGLDIKHQGKLAMSNQYYTDQYILTMAAPKVGINLSFSLLPEPLIDATVLQTEEVWKAITAREVEKFQQFGGAEKYVSRSGTYLKDLLLANRQKELRAIESAITQGMIQGRSYQQTARNINDIATTGYKNALRIARTEGHRNQQAGHYAMSQQAKNEGLDVKRMIVSTLDNRTRRQSAIMDEQKEDENGMFTYPNGHKYAMPGNTGVPGYDINDRESTIDIIEGMDPEERTGKVKVGEDKDGNAIYENQTFSYKNFDKWADENGIKYNRYGELVR